MRRSQLFVAGVAISALVGGLSTGTAVAGGAGSADLTTSIYAPDSPVANDADSDYQITVYNSGDDVGGGGSANGVQVAVIVTGATLVRVEDDYDPAPGASCSITNPTHAICSVSGPLAAFDQRTIDAVVTGGANGGTESVVATASETPATADPDHSNDSFEADADVVTPPTATFTTAVATPDADADGVTLQATLKVGSTPVDNKDVDVYVKQQGASNSSYVELFGDGVTGDDGVHHGVVHIDVDSYLTVADQDVSAALQGPVTFKLMHPADADADTASATIDVTPRPVTVTLTAPAVTTYSRGGQVTIKGSVAVTKHPNVPLSAPLVLQTRPTGSSGAWQDANLFNQASPGSALYYVEPSHNTDYRLAYRSEGPGSASTNSDPKTLLVKQRVKAVASPNATTRGGRSSVVVTVGPANHGGKVVLEKQSGGKWKTVAHGSLSAKGKRTWAYKYKKTGSSYRVVSKGTSTNAGNTSKVATVKVEKHGGGSAKQHAFLLSEGGVTARWNPCKPVHYKVNTHEAPKGALAAVKETIRRISQITKIHYVYDGKTSFIPSQGRNQREAAVIAWAKPNQTNLVLGGGIIGEGGGTVEQYGTNKPVFTSGYAVLLAGYKLKPGFGAGQTEGDLLLHELGHMTGLDHVTQESQIMYPEIEPRAVSMYGAGDYRGLQLLGRSQGCLKTPPKTVVPSAEFDASTPAHVFSVGAH